MMASWTRVVLGAVEALNAQISEELILKIGIHRGHSMAVTVNDRVDYFGQSVNIAARVQALADASEVYLTADVRRSPGVAEVLEARDVAVAEVLVKGVSERLEVYRVGAGG